MPIAVRCNRSGPRFPFRDMSSAVEKRTTKIFSHDRPACVGCQLPKRRIVSCPDLNDASFVTALLGAKANRSRRDGHEARGRSVSPASSYVRTRSYVTRRWLKVNSHDEATSIGVAYISRKTKCK